MVRFWIWCWDFLYFKIDRKRKIFIYFIISFRLYKIRNSGWVLQGKQYTFDVKTEKWKTKFNPENYKAKNFSEEVIDAKAVK